MAGADYRHCDVCGCKAFYDAGLNWEFSPTDFTPAQVKYCGEERGHYLDFAGDWAVICINCAKTHKTIVVPKEFTDKYYTEGGDETD